MMLETKKLWFKKVQIFLPLKTPERVTLEKQYDSVILVTHQKLVWPGWREREKDTALIDLTLSEEDLFAKFSDTTRNEIRKTYKNADLEYLENPDFETIYPLYEKFERSQGRKPVNLSEMKNFRPFLALYKNEPVYGFFIIESAPYARIRSIFSKRLEIEDKETIKVISNSGRRLMWEICLSLKKRNFVFLDVASVNQSNPKSANIAKFKLSFGGSIVKEYTYMYKSNFFLFLEKAKKLLSFN